MNSFYRHFSLENPNSSNLPNPVIVGVLNCTPDSFYDGGNNSPEARATKALQMVQQGASMIDIGGESSRPGAEPLAEKEEIERILPTLTALREQSSVPISIDTTKSSVARVALDNGATSINDISAGSDPEMFPLVAQHQVPYIIMHMQGTPKTMQAAPLYKDVNTEIISYLQEKTDTLLDLGLAQENIIWDPGIGFGKSIDHNLSILRSLKLYTTRAPVMLGVSRKSFIGALDPRASSPENRLAGSLAALTCALDAHVGWYRVHDVYETKQFLMVYSSLRSTSL